MRLSAQGDLTFLFVYLDDILVASECKADHLSQMRSRLRTPQPTRPHSEPSEVPVWAALPEKVAAISDFPQPHTTKALQEFLWMVNFYHRFVPHAANLMRPLFGALKGKAPNHTID
ncbi:hypothetical protein AAFF_G00007510 [Aldrovandia affinis]|uniref:Reverse transcriptase n=1 Tax=Aldrovandia affinis TaxID=143900 RepID=A0AAD7T6U5_9TELE|nr:hypothetical protein AAFF_G00007510 [Aldrovandia affinis]